MSRWHKMDGVADLPERAFSDNKFTRTYEGGGGSQQSNVTQTDIPEWLKPYTITNVESAQDVISKPYQAYTGAEVAGFTPDQLAAQKNITAFTAPTEFGAAQNTMADISNIALGGSKYIPTDFSTIGYAPGTTTSGYTAGTISSGYTPQEFTGDIAKAAMDPYMQAVVDEQKKQIQQDYNRSKSGRAAQAVKAGAFGGSRQGVQEAVAESEMLDRMAQAQATGLQSAYQQGMGQFNVQEQAKQTAGQMGMTAQQQTQLAQQQQEQLKQSAGQMTQQDAQFAANYAKDVLSSQESANQFAAQYGQQALQIAQQAAEGQAKVAAAQGEMDMAILKLQNAVGAEQQALAQKEYDAAKAKFESERDYDRQNIMFMNAVLRGTPMGSTSTSSQFSATNPYAQAVGAGIAGLGAYQKFS